MRRVLDTESEHVYHSALERGVLRPPGAWFDKGIRYQIDMPFSWIRCLIRSDPDGTFPGSWCLRV